MSDVESETSTDLEQIKKLFVLLLIDRGFNQEQLGKVLGVSQAGISRMSPGGVPKKKAK